MEVHRQRCQACGSIDLRNILQRAPGHPQTVYVRCTQCKALVARYELSSYYHHGKGFESWIRSYRGTARESGRDVQREFEETKEEAVRGYEEAVQALGDQDKDV